MAHKKQLGFTLLEVLVAIAIFAIAAGAIVKTTSEHLNSANQLKAITVATWVANNQLSLASIENKRQWPAKNNLTGQSKMANGTWYWQQTVSKTDDPDIAQVTVSVYTDSERKDFVTSVSTFLGRSV